MTSIFRTEVSIPVGGSLLAGRLHRNVDNLFDQQPGLVASGSWLTVKEQMADVYAAQLAARGYSVLTFDFTGWGSSDGAPRQTEMPARKIADIVAATRFLGTLSCIGEQIGYVGICASAMYAAAAVEVGAPIDALACIAGWFHDTSSVAGFYGGPAGVAERIRRGQVALERSRTGQPPCVVPAYDEGNDRAGMSIAMDYYANPTRGRLPIWRNEMSEESWIYWLTFDGLSAAERLQVPTLFVHGDECALPDNVKRIHQRIGGPKQLVWHPGFQVDFYDRHDLVALSVDAADAHFQKYIARR